MRWALYIFVTALLLAVCYLPAGMRRNKETKEMRAAYHPAQRPQSNVPDSLADFAETLIGTPYNYGCAKPETGFDCSGFITYVFEHFNLHVPRSSVDFTHRGKEVPDSAARRGDLILFTGTDPNIRVVGHMGIVVSNTDSLRFIHSTSGKEYSVTITPLNEHYRKRFMKVIRVFDDRGNLVL
jgi:cell wall-associated NlpC family hydrolase